MKKIHFIGIGGISMSGIAELLLSEGYEVSGSDAHESDITRKLEEQGARIGYPQKAENIPGDTDVVVMTAAIHEDNPELVEARRRGLKNRDEGRLPRPDHERLRYSDSSSRNPWQDYNYRDDIEDLARSRSRSYHINRRNA